MLCGVRVEFPSEFVEEQAHIAHDPKRAQQELLYLNGKLRMLEAERKTFYAKANKPERCRLTLERQRDEQCARSRRSELAQQQAETKVEQLEQLRKVMERQMSEMLAERDNEKVRGDQLQRQLNKLRAEAKSGQRSVNLALRKLTQSPLVAKRLAAACHPDKVPSELSDVATELFRFVQSIRDDR